MKILFKYSEKTQFVKSIKTTRCWLLQRIWSRIHKIRSESWRLLFEYLPSLPFTDDNQTAGQF